MKAKTHWEEVYATKPATDTSWFQEHAELSLQLLEQTGAGPESQIIDVGGGASTLVDDLLHRGFHHVTVLDLSRTALRTAQKRLGDRSPEVIWLEADITRVHLPRYQFDVWHDRAVFHFLTGAEDRQHYVEMVRHAVKPGGHVIVATFALDGPNRCSGLDTMRYSPESLHGEFGSPFELVQSLAETHHTPFGSDQKFIYCYCRKQ
jgi:SAM-dependent methyltransferase